MAHNVTVASANHDFSDETKNIIEAGSIGKKITIGSNVWIGAGATVTMGVTISDGAVVGANSVVTKYVPPNVIVAGVPAKIIGNRYE